MLFSGVATQMVSVAVGWQVYAIHHSAFDLGLIGLAEFVPAAAAGAADGATCRPAVAHADRRDLDAARGGSRRAAARRDARRRASAVAVRRAGRCDRGGCAARQPCGAFADAGDRPCRDARERDRIALDRRSGRDDRRAGRRRAAVRIEPGGGVRARRGVARAERDLRAVDDEQRADPADGAATSPRSQSLLGGIAFIRTTPIMLGAITLDLFAVLFGGAVALLPLFAKSILHTGPFGLGVLRSSVAVGALLAGIRLARRPLGRKAGRTLLLVVGAFGASMVVFGLSRWFFVSAIALAVSGFVDMISMNIRSTIGRVRDPEHRCADASTASRASSSAHRTSWARSSRGSPRRWSALCLRWSRVGSSRWHWRSCGRGSSRRSPESTGWRSWPTGASWQKNVPHNSHVSV